MWRSCFFFFSNVLSSHMICSLMIESKWLLRCQSTENKAERHVLSVCPDWLTASVTQVWWDINSFMCIANCLECCLPYFCLVVSYIYPLIFFPYPHETYVSWTVNQCVSVNTYCIQSTDLWSETFEGNLQNKLQVHNVSASLKSCYKSCFQKNCNITETYYGARIIL